MEGYISVAEAAHRLDRSIEQVRRYLREGKLAGRRIGQQWFIEEAGLVLPGSLRVGEPVAVYEATAMKTGKTKTRDRLISDDLIRAIEETREKIRAESGEFDVVAMVRQDREEH